MSKKMTPKPKAGGLTPMQMVKSIYPDAKAEQLDGVYGLVWRIRDESRQDRPLLSNNFKNAKAAWEDAANSNKILNKISNSIKKVEKKFSKRRQRIQHRIEAGEYTPKTPEQSLNIAFRRYGV